MKIEWQEKLQSFLKHIETISDEDLNKAEVTNNLIKTAEIVYIILKKDQLTTETGEKFIAFTDPDIPPGLIIPLSGKTFDYALYKVPFEGNPDVAKQLLKDLDSPDFQYILNNQLNIQMYYSDKIENNPAVKARIELIAQNSIDKFEKACINYNVEAETYNTTMKASVKSKVESERQKRSRQL